MKRHEQLQSLSRQHHNGLLAALLLKKGIEKTAEANVMTAFIIDFWRNHLKEHFENEEQVLHCAPGNEQRSHHGNGDRQAQNPREHC